ncbi:hypothetical protein RESH_04093 [Rhodopirellula europaea SH398]|uniref:Uncharacterized protein n=1 Tax=Rhodopirellula europaea SH398 TaxID=1263868 RepID=M5S188_9BACT|nr:hypothetical protein RESH_04093 [Rhodopirellula europaea SH398]
MFRVFPKASALIRLTYPRIGGVPIRFYQKTFGGNIDLRESTPVVCHR